MFSKGHITLGKGLINDIVIEDDSIEDTHATIGIRDNTIWITDHNSKHGTYIDEEVIRSNMPVDYPLGRLLRLGKSTSLIKIIPSFDKSEVTTKLPSSDQSKALDKQMEKLQIEVEIESIEEKKSSLLRDLEQASVEKKEAEIKVEYLSKEQRLKQQEIDTALKTLSDLKIETNQYRDAIDAKKKVVEEIHNLEFERAQVLKSINDSQREKHSEEDKLNDRIGDKKLELERTDGKRRVLDKELGDLTFNLDKLKTEKVELVEEIHGLKEQSINLKETIRDDKRIANDAEKKRELVDRELQNIESEKFSSEKDLASSKNELERISRQLSESSSEYESLSSKLFNERQELTKTQSNRDDLLGELESLNRSINGNKKSIEQSEMDILRLSNIIHDLESEKEQLTNESSNLKKNLLEIETERQNKISNLESLKYEIQAKLDEQIQKDTEYKQLLERANNAIIDEREAKAQLQVLTQQKDGLSREYADLEITLNDKKNEHAEIRAEIEQLESQKDETKLSHNKLRTEFDNLQNELEASKNELNKTKEMISASIASNEELTLEFNNKKNEVTQLRDQMKALEEGVRKNQNVYDTSERTANEMLAQKNTVEFDLQNLEAKKAHLEQTLQDLNKEKERKFEDMTQFKLRAEQDLEILRSKAEDEKRKHQVLKNEVDVFDRKVTKFNQVISDLEREKKLSAENLKSQKNESLKELQQLKDRILDEKNNLKECEFQTNKAKEKKQKAELDLSDVHNRIDRMKDKIDNFDSEREEQLKKLAELKLQAEHDLQLKQKLQNNDLELEKKKRRADIEVECTAYKSDKISAVDQEVEQKLAELEEILKQRELNFKHSQRGFVSESASRVQDLVNYELENLFAKESIPSSVKLKLDIKSIISDVFTTDTPDHKITKKAKLIYKLNSNKKTRNFIVALIIVIIGAALYSIPGI